MERGKAVTSAILLCIGSFLPLLSAERIGATASYVTTGQQFAEALETRTRHIVVNNHLDVHGLPHARCVKSAALEDRHHGRTWSLYCVQPETASIRGNCSASPNAFPEDLYPMRKRQCLLRISQPGIVFHLAEPGQHLWMEGLYLRVGNMVKKFVQLVELNIGTLPAQGPRLYMSVVTLHGNGNQIAKGIHVHSPFSKLYARGAELYQLPSVDHNALAIHAGSVWLERATIPNPYTTPHRFIAVDAGALGVKSSTLESITVAKNALLYVDNATAYAPILGGLWTVAYLQDAPKMLFLAADDPWLVTITLEANTFLPGLEFEDLNQVDGRGGSSLWARNRAPASGVQGVAPPSDFLKLVPGSHLAVGLTLGLLCSAALFSTLILCSVMWLRKRMRLVAFKPMASQDTGCSIHWLPSLHDYINVVQTRTGMPANCVDASVVCIAPSKADPATVFDSNPALTERFTVLGENRSAIATQLSSRASPPSRLRTTALGTDATSSWSQYDALHDALDSMMVSQVALYGRFRVMGPVDRRMGGQGLVQFVFDTANAQQYAVKFFIHRWAFEHERKLLTTPGVNEAISRSLAVEVFGNDKGTERSPLGYVFPPSIVTQRGQSLDEWLRSTRPHFATIVDAMMGIARQLAVLHRAGFVHRDIKPGNLVRLVSQSEHGWALIDFGCTAKKGSMAPLSFSLKYAAPETIEALERGDKVVMASPAVDIWAIGLICLEMITHKPVFPSTTPAATIRACLRAHKPLPWEDAETAPKLLAPLKGMRRSVMQCLSRVADHRPTAEQLLHSWEHMFNSPTTMAELSHCLDATSSCSSDLIKAPVFDES